MLKIQEFVFNPFQENTYVLFDETRDAVIVDPGCYENDEKQELTEFIESKNLKVKMLLNTHGHIDHVLGNTFVKDKFKVKLFIHKIDEPVMRAVKAYAGNYGFPLYQEASVDSYLEEGKTISFGTNNSRYCLFQDTRLGTLHFTMRKRKL